MGSIKSTVAYGPVYFNTQPNLQLSLTDNNILDALTLNVKMHDYNYAPGSELIFLSYRIYFKLLSTLNLRCKLYYTSAQTILVETNFARSKHFSGYNTSKNVYNFSKIIVKQIISIEDWGPIPNWFLNWWSYHRSDYKNITRSIAKKISVQDGDKEAMINSYLEEIKRSLFLNITQYKKSDTSMRSETSEDAIDDIQEAQPIETTLSEDALKKAEDFLRKMEEKEK
ncbi:hypothetical protein H5410_050227 [Solanum commersonii]|uniref:Uncharacterized protein n=1 Tax=Solanum commersonii TaxID=4109 RepID=A0A9J5WX93_SOLCO|nr:hypothetical protein H5410_050227 [Solanum commersonii]